MRLATAVVGIGIALIGGVSEASESSIGSTGRTHGPAYSGEGFVAAPTDRFITRNSQQGNVRTDAIGAMAFVPSQSQPSFMSSGFEPAVRPPRRYNPANTPLPKTRTLEDHLLTGFVALMLIAYQLRRKHRFLRPHQFST